MVMIAYGQFSLDRNELHCIKPALTFSPWLILKLFSNIKSVCLDGNGIPEFIMLERKISKVYLEAGVTRYWKE